MAKFKDLVQHYQLNRLMYEKFKEDAAKKVVVLRHKLEWQLECSKENIAIEGPIKEGNRLKYNVNLVFIYEDPISHKKDPKVITLPISFIPPLGQKIEFNGKEYMWTDSLKTLFDAFVDHIMQDKTIYGVTDK